VAEAVGLRELCELHGARGGRVGLKDDSEVHDLDTLRSSIGDVR
jgi:hypothetical protein